MAIAFQQDTRGRILDAALDLFSEYGFEGTTLQQIADRLGLTKAALYYHFRSKDDLLEALHEPAAADMDVLLDAYEGRPSTPAVQREFVEDWIDYLLRHRRLIAYIVRDLAALTRPTFAGRAVERRNRLEALITGGELDFTERVRVAMVVGGAHAAIAQYPERDSAELREALIDIAGTVLVRASRSHARQRRASGGKLVDRTRQ